MALDDWLVISNCQTVGFARCLTLFNPRAKVHPLDSLDFKAEIIQHLDRFQRVFVADYAIDDPALKFRAFDHVFAIPTLDFDGYHPDLCYAEVGGRRVQSPMGDYHSLLCLEAFRAGLGEPDARRLFCGRVYQAAGYFAVWAPARQSLLERAARHEYDLTLAIRRWSERESFMHSVNHPRIGCLRDLAAMATLKAGFAPARTQTVPHDNLAVAGTFPVYDEIAEVLGVDGSYAFVPGGDYRILDLDQFIAGSFESYRAHDPARLAPAPQYAARRAGVAELIAGGVP